MLLCSMVTQLTAMHCHVMNVIQEKGGFAEELEATRQLLKVFRKEFDGVPFYFKLGQS